MANSRAMTRLWKSRSGAIAAQVALCLPLLIGATALTIDMGLNYVVRNVLQVTADSSALAGVTALPDETLMDTRALAAAEANMPVANHKVVLVGADVVAGNWNSVTRVFTPGGNPRDAVMVTTRHTEANGNAVPAIFGGIFGKASYDVFATAVATWTGSDDCFRNGLVANGIVEAGSSDTFGAGACMHGQSGIKIGSNNEFQEGSVVSRGPGTPLQQGSDNDFNGELVEQDLNAFDNAAVAVLIQAIKTTSGSTEIGDLGAAPPWWNGQVQNVAGDWNLGCNPAPKLYIVSGKADLSSCTGTLDNFGIYAEQEIKLGGGGSGSPLIVKDMLFASKTIIETASWINIGASGCGIAGGAVFFAANQGIKFGSNIRMTGVQIIAGAKDGKLDEKGVEFGDDLWTSGVSAQSAGLIKIGSDPVLSVCDRADHIFPGTVNKVFRLVD